VVLWAVVACGLRWEQESICYVYGGGLAWIAFAADGKAPVDTLIVVLDILKAAGAKGELAAFTEQGTP